VKNFVNTEMQGGATQDDLNSFYNGVRGAEFLFDGETRDFIKKIGALAWRAINAHARYQRNPNHPQADRLIDEAEELGKFLAEQDQPLEEMFRPYLDLSKAGLRSWWPW
jgi:hypothetical protein